MTENELAHKIIGIVIEVHTDLGPGLLEKAYEECLFYKIIKSGLSAEKQKPMPLTYEGVHLECGYRVDILVERKLVLEIKAVEALHEVFVAQVLTYLRLGGYKLGLLINFNELMLRNGIRRVIHGKIE
jgi:GxxExxY protein